MRAFKQTAFALACIASGLLTGGGQAATLQDIVRITTYLEDTRDFGRYNKAFQEGIGNAVLARTTVEAKAVINTKIEMDAIVYKPFAKV